jgi:alkanesulfonate monooxygenase SsuD/methylene tetrahydromethanopterin reductase-like flavin-dependent oxidoreductase (luciferase family)
MHARIHSATAWPPAREDDAVSAIPASPDVDRRRMGRCPHVDRSAAAGGDPAVNELAGARLPVGVNLTSVGVSSAWWLDAAIRLEQAGYRGAWCWDHFISRGRLDDPLLECWTTLTAVLARTTRLRAGSFVLNVMNRHPAVVARMAATLQDQSGGRLDLGIGIGGHPVEHAAMGIPFPDLPERVARLEEAVQVMRLLWTGGPVSFGGRFYSLDGARAFPVPTPAPRIIIGGETPAGARLAGRLGNGWSAFARTFERDLPGCLDALAATGRPRDAFSAIVSVDLARDLRPERQPFLADPVAEMARWRDAGADEIIVSCARPQHIDALVEAAGRAGLA